LRFLTGTPASGAGVGPCRHRGLLELFSVEADVNFAAAAPGQALPWLGVAAAGHLESAGGTFGGPVKLQLAFAYPTLLARVGWGWRSGDRCRLRPWRFGGGVCRWPFQGFSIPLAEPVRRPGTAQERVSVGHCSSV